MADTSRPEEEEASGRLPTLPSSQDHKSTVPPPSTSCKRQEHVPVAPTDAPSTSSRRTEIEQFHKPEHSVPSSPVCCLVGAVLPCIGSRAQKSPACNGHTQKDGSEAVTSIKPRGGLDLGGSISTTSAATGAATASTGTATASKPAADDGRAAEELSTTAAEITATDGVGADSAQEPSISVPRTPRQQSIFPFLAEIGKAQSQVVARGHTATAAAPVDHGALPAGRATARAATGTDTQPALNAGALADLQDAFSTPARPIRLATRSRAKEKTKSRGGGSGGGGNGKDGVDSGVEESGRDCRAIEREYDFVRDAPVATPAVGNPPYICYGPRPTAAATKTARAAAAVPKPASSAFNIAEYEAVAPAHAVPADGEQRGDYRLARLAIPPEGDYEINDLEDLEDMAVGDD